MDTRGEECLQEENGKSLFICPHNGCHKSFSRNNRLIIHLRTHTGERPFVCDFDDCTKTYTRAAHLARHKQVCHQVRHRCEKIRCEEEECGEEFTSHHNLKKHIRRKHEQARYQCTEIGCGRSFTKHQHLTIHQYEHTQVNPFKCQHEGCGQSFLLPSKLRRHMKSHDGYTCEEEGCEAVFTKWTLYRKHRAVHHSTVHTCPQCNKQFSQKQWLKQHKKIHQDSREMFVCPRENCGRAYLDQRNLTAHIRSYHDGVRFHCPQPDCDRKFVTEQKLREHKKLHDPNRPPVKPKKKRKRKSGFERDMEKGCDTHDETANEDLIELLHSNTKADRSDLIKTSTEMLYDEKIHNVEEEIYIEVKFNKVQSNPFNSFPKENIHVCAVTDNVLDNMNMENEEDGITCSDMSDSISSVHCSDKLPDASKESHSGMVHQHYTKMVDVMNTVYTSR